MTGKGFVDTNVIVYAFGSKMETGPDPRIQIAQQIMIDGAAISVQVLNEFVDVCRRKVKLKWDQIEAALEIVKELCGPPVAITAELHESALRISKHHGFRIYDSLIVAAAADAGCSKIFSEDLQHGQIIEGLRIENPFVGI